MIICFGCGKKTAEKETAKLPVAESFEEREARFDTTVWRDEMLAQEYERSFVKLRDKLIRATNKLAALAQFEFEQIVLPTPNGAAQSVGLDITIQDFTTESTNTLSHPAWQETLKRLESSGCKLDQVEWSHERFVPPTQTNGAVSEFAFALDGERSNEHSRFSIRGTLQVEWEVESGAVSEHKPRRLLVLKLKMLERAGFPGFRKLFAVTPEAPEERGVFVNLHPLIVTDFDGDGNEDIILAGGNRLFKNNGKAQFEPMEFIAGKVFHGVSSAGLVADFNGDGFPDFLTVASDGVWSNQLVLYEGAGTIPFTNEPILVCPSLNLQAPSVMTCGDIDRDGDLDVWLAQYKPPYVGGQVPTPYYDANDGYPSFLLLNDGQGHFQDGTVKAGLSAKSRRRTYAVSFADLNGDGNLDLVTVSDFAGVDLYYNDGMGVFRDETSRLYNPHLFGMSLCLDDFDQNGSLDLLAIGMSLPTVHRLQAMGARREDFADRTSKRSDMAYGNRLYHLRSGEWSKPDFADQLAPSGWTWGVTAFDYANDGNLDVYLANGHISGKSSEDYDSHFWRHDIYVGSSREDPRMLRYFAQPFQGINTGKTSWNGYQHNVFFYDTGNHHYLDIAFLMDVADETDCRAVVSADFNNDGRMDLAFTQSQFIGNSTTGRHRMLVYLNQLRNSGHWIGVKLLSRKPGRSAIGARVSARNTDRTWVAQIVTGSSFQAQHPNMVHFGLGEVSHLDELVVQWPNGETETIRNPSMDTYHRF